MSNGALLGGIRYLGGGRVVVGVYVNRLGHKEETRLSQHCPDSLCLSLSLSHLPLRLSR